MVTDWGEPHMGVMVTCPQNFGYIVFNAVKDNFLLFPNRTLTVSGKSTPVRKGITYAVAVGDWKALFGIHWSVLKSVTSECEFIA